MIERRIIIGLITNTEFIKEIRPLWNGQLLKSNVARRLGLWCIQYFDTYGKAPGRQIETIFYDRVKRDKVPQEIAEEIEEDILPDLSDEYEEGINYQYLLDVAKPYFIGRELELHTAKINALLQDGDAEEAKKLAQEYRSKVKEARTDLDLSSEQSLEVIRRAFSYATNAVVMFPGALGELWNEHFVKGGFIGLLAPEKRGKTWVLLDIAMRAVRQKAKVAFFQAGDMTEDQQMRRICIQLAQKSDKEKYCGIIYKPMKDCMLNQNDTCDKAERECSYGIFDTSELTDLYPDIRTAVTIDMLRAKAAEYPHYTPCYNCKEYINSGNGTVWYGQKNVGDALQVDEAIDIYTKFFIKKKRYFKLSSHPNGTLSVHDMEMQLKTWKEEEGFVPDLILLDYADLCIDHVAKEERAKQNNVWKGLRALTQKEDILLVTPTQSDAASYEQGTLKLKNFSEDKRKYSHVTGFFGLNQDPEGREAQLGIMRINQLAIREGEAIKKCCYVLQSLKTGQPYITSFW